MKTYHTLSDCGKYLSDNKDREAAIKDAQTLERITGRSASVWEVRIFEPEKTIKK